MSELKRHGWTIDRHRGSHTILTKEEQSLSVPVHAAKLLPLGTFLNILRTAGIDPNEFRRLKRCPMPSYSIVITEEPDGTGYNVVVPALDGCFTCGDTLVEAIANAHEAIDLYIESLVDQGRPVPGDVTTTITTVQVGAPLSAVS